MPKKSQPKNEQDAINEYTHQLISSPAWKYFREEGEKEMKNLLQDILTVASPNNISLNDKMYSMRDVMCIKYWMLRHFLNFPVEIIALPMEKMENTIAMDDVYSSGLERPDINGMLESEDPYAI